MSAEVKDSQPLSEEQLMGVSMVTEVLEEPLATPTPSTLNDPLKEGVGLDDTSMEEQGTAVAMETSDEVTNIDDNAPVAMETVDMVDVVGDVAQSSKSTSSDEPEQKANIIKFAEQYSISLASRRFKVPTSTIKKWMKSSDSVQMQPKFNSPGQGRKLTYSQETDEAIAAHVREQVAEGAKVTLQYVCNYAKTIIQQENPQFTASTGWAQRFLVRHSIDLGVQHHPSKKSDPSSPSETRGRPLTYSPDTDKAIADYVRRRLSEGQIMTNTELRRYAKELITKENPNFTGSASWAQNFLLRHKIALQSPVVVSTTTTSSSFPPPTSVSLSTSLSESSLHPAAEITPTTTSAVYSDIPTTSVAMDTGVDDPMKTALAILTGENIDSAILNPAQAAALQSSLSELSTDPVSLVDLLSNAQQMQDQSGDGPVALITHGLESPSGNIYLGLGGSEAFGSGLSGSVATHLNPNTQTPLPAPVPRSVEQQPEVVTQASRPLSYTKETDLALASWVQEQQAAGKKVTFASLRAYAKKLISNENPNFNASVGWVTPFLLRHNLDLSVNKKKKNRKGSMPRKISSDDGKEREEDSEENSASDPQLQTADPPIITPEILVSAITSLADQSWNNTSQTAESTNGQAATTAQLSKDLTQQAECGTPGAEETEVEKKAALKKVKKEKSRTRHSLADKLEVVRLMKEYNLAAHFVCRMLGIANSTFAGWTKLVQQKGAELESLSTNKRRSNVSGQGRPLSYSKEKDEAIADWVRSQQQLGLQVAPSDLAKHATFVISQENPNFTASSGWQQKFLQRHGLQLSSNWAQKAMQAKADTTPQTTIVEDQQSIPAPVQTEEVVSNDFGSDRPYSEEVDEELAQWVKEKVQENGSLSVQIVCKKAEEMVVEQNPMFVATLGWAFKFLHRHKILLDPKPNVSVLESSRKRPSVDGTPDQSFLTTPKKPHTLETQDLSVSPSTGNLCEALLALSNQSGENRSIQAAVQSLQTAMQAAVQQASSSKTESSAPNENSSTSNTYFGKPAREFLAEEKEEVVRYANATTLQKAALKYGVAAPTVWRWRVELKLHQPKYTAMQKKYIIKFAETNSLKEASQRYGITGKTIQNWRKALQAEGELPTSSSAEENTTVAESGEPPVPGADTAEVVTYDNQSFQFIVDGGEVVETTNGKGEQVSVSSGGVAVDPLPLEVTSEVDIENVGMEYDVVSSEGHAAKPRCTPQEKVHILQYALDHTVREASQKFGISPGTLYYWKKSMGGGGSGDGHASSASLTSTTPNDSIMTVQYSGVSGDTSVLQGLRLADTPTAVSAASEQFIGNSATTAEALQSLPADINFLQAVSSLLNSSETPDSSGRKRKTSTSRRLDSVSGGGISSPTEVLVTPSFQATATSVSEQQEMSVSEQRETSVSEQQETSVSEQQETTIQLETQVEEEVEVSDQGTAAGVEEVRGEQLEEPATIEIDNVSQTVELSVQEDKP